MSGQPMTAAERLTEYAGTRDRFSRTTTLVRFDTAINKANEHAAAAVEAATAKLREELDELRNSTTREYVRRIIDWRETACQERDVALAQLAVKDEEILMLRRKLTPDAIEDDSLSALQRNRDDWVLAFKKVEAQLAERTREPSLGDATAPPHGTAAREWYDMYITAVRNLGETSRAQTAAEAEVARLRGVLLRLDGDLYDDEMDRDHRAALRDKIAAALAPEPGPAQEAE